MIEMSVGQKNPDGCRVLRADRFQYGADGYRGIDDQRFVFGNQKIGVCAEGFGANGHDTDHSCLPNKNTSKYYTTFCGKCLYFAKYFLIFRGAFFRFLERDLKNEEKSVIMLPKRSGKDREKIGKRSERGSLEMERIIWETWCREAVGRDCFAEIKREPSNVTEVLGWETLLKNIRRLNCDEKYKNDSVSDFEILSEWIRLLPRANGNMETGKRDRFDRKQALERRFCGSR